VLERFTQQHDGVELTVLEGYGGTLWHDLRDGHLDAVVASSSFASPDLRALELGAEPWVVMVGERHRLAGTGLLTARELHGERIAVTGHRDGAGHDREVARVLEQLGITAVLVHGAPGPAFYRGIANGDAVALTTAPEALPKGVLVRTLEPARTLAFRLLWRDETPSPALSEFIRVTAELADRAASTRPALSAVS
jgi:DNA-binding transcriptional LysR family regulator